MAEAMLRGLLKAGLHPENVKISEPVEARRQYMSDQFQVECKEANHEVAQMSDVVIMAVKPQVLEAVLTDLQERAQRNARITQCLIVSIVAGKKLSTYAQYLPTTRAARVMPNTPALVGCGASCYVVNDLCTDDDAKSVEAIMSKCGIVERLGNEALLDAVTGLSGSGPAYVYMLIEAMSDGGVRMGLPRQTATKLAAQTVMGAGQMVLKMSQHPGELKDAVTSPGGTTIAGVHALEAGAFRGTVINAVEAATRRSQELGK